MPLQILGLTRAYSGVHGVKRCYRSFFKKKTAQQKTIKIKKGPMVALFYIFL